MKDPGGFGAAVGQELLYLMASQVRDDPAVLLFLKKPVRTDRAVQTVGCKDGYLKHPPNRSLPDQLLCKDRAFHVDALPIIYHIFPSRVPACLGRPPYLLHGQHPRLIHKVILIVPQHPDSQAAPPGRADGAGNHLDVPVLKYLFLTRCHDSLGIPFHELQTFIRVRVPNTGQLGPCFQQPVADCIYMSMI